MDSLPHHDCHRVLFDLKRCYLSLDLLSIWKRMACPCGVREPGVARRARYFSLLRQRKVPKRKATPLSASPALRYGATCGAQVWRGLAQLAPLRVAQTHASPDPPNPALLGASRGAPGYRTSTRAIAALGPESRAQAPRAAQPGPSAAMARMDVRLFGCLDVRLSTPCWLRLRRVGCGVARASERACFVL